VTSYRRSTLLCVRTLRFLSRAAGAVALSGLRQSARRRAVRQVRSHSGGAGPLQQPRHDQHPEAIEEVQLAAQAQAAMSALLSVRVISPSRGSCCWCSISPGACRVASLIAERDKDKLKLRAALNSLASQGAASACSRDELHRTPISASPREAGRPRGRPASANLRAPISGLRCQRPPG